MTPAQLKQILRQCDVTTYFLPLISAMEEFDISTPKRQAAFIATIGHESMQLQVLQENLNYSAEALLKVFPTHFPGGATEALKFAHDERAIANRVYAGRNGNGDEASGDGWIFRGAGAIEITFRDNHQACGDHFGIDVLDVPAWLRTPEGALRSAGWYWVNRNLNELADTGNFDQVSDVVNLGHKTSAYGDSIGWADRLALYTTAVVVLC